MPYLFALHFASHRKSADDARLEQFDIEFLDAGVETFAFYVWLTDAWQK